MSSISKIGLEVIRNGLVGKSKISELSISQGLFSGPFLSLLPGDACLFRTDFPMQNYNILATASLPVQTFLVPGTIFKQLHPSNSLDFIYAFQVFNQLSLPIYASDHLLSTLSRQPQIKQALRYQKDLDLSYLLDLRHKELEVGGEIVFNILAPPEDSKDPYSWDCLDLAVQASIGIFPEASRRKLNLLPCFRTKEELLQVLHRFTGKFEICEIEEYVSVMPAFQEYVDKGDAQKYAKELEDFWRYPITVMTMRAFGDSIDKAEVLTQVQKIMKEYHDICEELRPKTLQNIMFVRLIKV